MLKYILFLSLGLVITVTSFSQVQVQKPKPKLDSSQTRIFWDEWYKLEWSDFQSEESAGKGVAAQSSIGLPYSFISDGEGTLKMYINVCFIKNESWSKEDKQNNVLLQHEQLHFDIAELFRRMIVRELLNAKMDKDNYKEVAEKIINKYWNVKYRAMQDKYDKETNFSKTIREQINWNKFVKQELINYKDFTFNEIEINLIHFD
ncbi:MAG: hypothetical protein HND54_07665 [Bacteroidetes bacterium]|nr:hypothetical protein [Bacteroidota bacterium]